MSKRASLIGSSDPPCRPSQPASRGSSDFPSQEQTLRLSLLLSWNNSLDWHRVDEGAQKGLGNSSSLFCRSGRRCACLRAESFSASACISPAVAACTIDSHILEFRRKSLGRNFFSASKRQPSFLQTLTQPASRGAWKFALWATQTRLLTELLLLAPFNTSLWEESFLKFSMLAPTSTTLSLRALVSAHGALSPSQLASYALRFQPISGRLLLLLS